MKKPVYRNYLLTMLTVILAFNFVDRLALGIVLQDIKIDLNLSDTQLGFLTGIAFALFYSIMGIPIARWADRGNRVAIISWTLALWSAAVAWCGMATSFAQLLLIRVCVAIGEAGCVPPSHSLIADHFDRTERPRAVARFLLGGSLAYVIGYFGAGWLNELYGWQVMFIVLGLPGMFLALIVWFTLKDPRQVGDRSLEAVAGTLHTSNPALDERSLKEVFVTLWRNVAFRHILFAFSIWFFFGYGIHQWQPAFFIRSHGLKTGELGTWFAVIFGLGDALGIYVGGELATRYAAEKERLQLLGCVVALSILAVVRACAYAVSDLHVALAALTLVAVGSSIAQGPLYATIQTLVPPHMRAMSIALVYLFGNLLGMGLGPLVVGAVSDAFQARLGEESLRYALVISCPGYLWAAWHVWRASQLVHSDHQSSDSSDCLRGDEGAPVKRGRNHSIEEAGRCT